MATMARMTAPATPSSEAQRHLARFKSDFPFYSGRCLKIRTKEGEIRPLVLNRAQRHLHKVIEAQRAKYGWVRVIGLKGRQQGFSTYVEGRFYWRVSFGFGLRAFILTHEDKATANMFEMADRFHRLCPQVLRPSKGPAHGHAMHFNALDSGYQIGTAKTKDTGRSGTYQLFHGSEVAHWPNAEDHMAGVGQAVPLIRGTEIILESTGGDLGQLFHRYWTAALAGDNEYIPVFVPWYWQEEYQMPVEPGFVLDVEEAEYAQAYELTNEQMAWRRHKIRNDFGGDTELFQWQYPATEEEGFLRGTDKSYIPPSLTARARKAEGVEARGAKVLGVDPAEYGDDKTAIARRHGRVVYPIERHARKGTMEIAGIVAGHIDAWKPDAVLVDVTGVGSGVADRLKELGYSDLVIRVHNGGAADDPDLYVRKRDEQWGRVKAWLEDSPCQLPDDPILAMDLSAPHYTYDSSRRLRLEPKEAMKKRGLDSPDSGDALALTFAYAVAPKGENRRRESGRPKRKRVSWKAA